MTLNTDIDPTTRPYTGVLSFITDSTDPLIDGIAMRLNTSDALGEPGVFFFTMDEQGVGDYQYAPVAGLHSSIESVNAALATLTKNRWRLTESGNVASPTTRSREALAQRNASLVGVRDEDLDRAVARPSTRNVELVSDIAREIDGLVGDQRALDPESLSKIAYKIRMMSAALLALVD